MAQNNNNEINKIEVIREINDRYVVIKYFDAEVIYDKETKFINATKLCQHISKLIKKQKLFKNWLRLKQTRDFILDLIENHNENFVAQKRATTKEENNEEILKSNNLGYIIKDGYKKHMEIRGTYLHLDLIPQLCNWASKEYAFKISYIINYINGIKDYDSAYSKLKNEELKAKDDEIESKTDEIKKLEEEHQKQIKAKDEEINKLNKKLKESEKKSDNKTGIIKEKNEKVKELEQKIKDKTKELKELRKTKSDDDIEIQKLKQDIELLKSQLATALKDNETLNDKLDRCDKTINTILNIMKEDRQEFKQCLQELKECRQKLDQRNEEINQMVINQAILTKKVDKLEKEKNEAKKETREINKELKGVPELIIISVSKHNDKKLYINRINEKYESLFVKRLKEKKYKIFNKFQTYNSVVNYNKAIDEYKQSGIIETNGCMVRLINISLDEFINRIKQFL